MSWTRSERKRFATWLAVMLAGGAIGYVYTVLAYPQLGPQAGGPFRGMRAGLLVAGTTGYIEIYVINSPLGARLRRLPMAAAFFIRLVVQTAIVVVCLYANTGLTALIEGGGPADIYTGRNLLSDVVFSLAALAAIHFVLDMRSLIGPQTFGNLVIGRYHHPRREERIFAFFDLVGSSGAAERLGDERFHAYVSSVFFDIDRPIIDHGGDIHSYVGDALIAVWPLATPEANGNAVAAAFAVMDTLKAMSSRYERQFGEAPAMRAVLHGGPVVIGETGNSRRQITYLGDVVNVTARIEVVAKSLGADVAISASLLERTRLPAGIAATPAGAHRLKGIAGPVEVFVLAPSRQFAPMPGGAKNLQ